MNQVREELKAAIRQGLIWQAFQPIIAIKDRTVAGFEVLARWTDPTGEERSPATFLPLVKRCKLLGMLSLVQIHRSCTVAAGWPGEFFLAFNLTPQQLAVASFPKKLAEIAAETGFPLHRIQVEITEDALITKVEKTLSILRELSLLGVTVSIDDFGTGYSSLARLEAFQFQKLKIDARFVSGVDQDASKRRIVAAIIGLGHSLGIRIVAEGVEREEEEAVLQGYGCDLGQGWLYSKAVPADFVPALLAQRGTSAKTTGGLDASPFLQLLQLEALYRQAPVGLCFVDRAYRHVRANHRFAAIHGMTPEQIEGRTIFEVMNEEKSERAKIFLDRSLQSDVAIENRYQSEDGKDYLFFSSSVRDIDGSIIGFSVVSSSFREDEYEIVFLKK